VLAYLSRYTHPVAISNSQLVSAHAKAVAFRWKDYRTRQGDRQKIMRLATDEFVRRFLIHILPDGFHRIRHYGLLASATRKASIAKIRSLLGEAQAEPTPQVATEVILLPCVDHAPAAVARCGSSRSSGAGKIRNHGHHHASRQHDETPVPQPDQPPVPARAPGRRRLSKAPETAGSQITPHSPEAERTTILQQNPPARDKTTTAAYAGLQGGHDAWRSFPISSAKLPAASSLGGFPTRADRAPGSNLTPRPASENLHLS
jgi:hypothetical protein